MGQLAPPPAPPSGKSIGTAQFFISSQSYSFILDTSHLSLTLKAAKSFIPFGVIKCQPHAVLVVFRSQSKERKDVKSLLLLSVVNKASLTSLLLGLLDLSFPFPRLKRGKKQAPFYCSNKHTHKIKFENHVFQP